MRYVDPFDKYVLSTREIGQEEWTVYNIAPLTLDEALTCESILEREDGALEIKIQYNGSQEHSEVA
jgi:hypothetical protein